MAVVLCVLVTACVFYILLKTWKFYKTLYSIPTPSTHLLNFLSDPDTILPKIRKYSAQYYPIYRLSILFYSVAVLLDPNDIELVFSSTKHLSKSRVYHYLRNWLGTGLLTSTGTKWHTRRKILTPAFHFEILQQFVHVFNDETDKLLEMLEKECQNPSTNIVPLITNYTLQSIGETAMGFKNVSQEENLTYKDAVHKMGQLLLKRVSVPWYHLQLIYNFSSLSRQEQSILKILHDFTNKIIFQREKEAIKSATKKNRMAMLDLLLTAKKEGANIDHEGIREEVDTFMFEGHDTTSMAISFTLLILANLKEVQERVAQEIFEVLGPSDSPTVESLQALKYTERCIKECLRLFPSVPFITRRAGADFKTTTGYTIPKGTILHIHIFDVHRNPKHYPDPEKFDPDRFLPENVSKRHPFSYIPFSAGPRNCIGQRFALLEIKAVLCGILRRFVLEAVDDFREVTFKPDLVLRPKGDIRIKILSR